MPSVFVFRAGENIPWHSHVKGEMRFENDTVLHIYLFILSQLSVASKPIVSISSLLTSDCWL